MQRIVAKTCFLLVLGLVNISGVGAAEVKDELISVIRGEIWYRERIALPPGSELSITLEDVAKMDVAAEIIASDRMLLEAAPPFPFELSFEVGRLHRRGQYTMRARIENNGQLLFINTERVQAFPEGGGPVKIRVDHVARSRGNGDSRRIPDASLTNTYWKLVEMDARPVVTGQDQREAHIVLEDDGDLHGYAGCNWMRGGYEQGGDNIQFPPALITRRACMHGMDTEDNFLANLLEVRRFAINGDSLTMFNGDARANLRFEAVYLNQQGIQ